MIRIVDINSFAGGPKENKKCRLFYLDTGLYVLYDTDDSLLWKSDAVPESAFAAGTRYNALREISEEAIHYDTGSEIILPQIREGLSEDWQKQLVDSDPRRLSKKYPDLVWLADQEVTGEGE